MLPTKNKELLFKDLVRYENGCLYWTQTEKFSNAKPGDRAGALQGDGYRSLQHHGINAKEHRIVWMLHHGKIPNGLVVDHINRDKVDNRIENLRLLTNRENASNWQKRDLPTGVYLRNSGKYFVHARANGSQHYVGTYDTIQQAVEARAAFLDAVGAASY